MKEGCDILLYLFRDIRKNYIKTGVNVIDIDRYIGSFFENNNCVSAPIKDYDFPGFSCISINDVVTHGIPSNYQLRSGDVVKVDISFKYRDYHYFDSARTYIVDPGTDLKTTRHTMMYAFNKYIVHYAINSLNRKLQNNEIVCYEDFGKLFYALAEHSEYGIVADYGGHIITAHELHKEEAFVDSLYHPLDRSYRKINEGEVFCIEPLVTERYSGINSRVYKKNKWEIYTMRQHISTHYEVMATLENNRIICLTGSSGVDL